MDGMSDRAGTQRWTADTGAMVFSATKGVASTVIHRLADRGLLSYDEPVAEYLPEFGEREGRNHGSRRPDRYGLRICAASPRRN